jgi:tRNA (guanine37-N1)-methyltransferase
MTSESFAENSLLEYPQYTRPAEFRGMRVPAVLQSGDHGAIRRWRHEQSIARTRARRPELIDDSGDESS